MSSHAPISLRVTIPVCGFRKGYAREFLETEEVPPPSTVYGFLLSLVGEEDRRAYLGTQLACAIVQAPQVSTVLRTVWRVKSLKDKAGNPQLPGVGSNRRPDFQEILTGLELVIWVLDGPLADRLRRASSSPADIERFGGLSLGESRDLVNDIWWASDLTGIKCQWVTRDPQGDLPLPVWVDHVGSIGTIWAQFTLVAGMAIAPREGAPQWITIREG
ncbi:MAG TPA: type I-MYXAN CRISPR-associated protein Cas5/Cmx5/DevS [bacterium]